MGMISTFEGAFDITPKLDKATLHFLKYLCETRRMAWKGLDEDTYGVDGEFYTFHHKDYTGVDFGQIDNDWIQSHPPLRDNPSLLTSSILTSITPRTQPSYWCLWEPTETKIRPPSGPIRFDEPEAWIQYLINKVLSPLGYTLNGRVEWEDGAYRGVILLTQNKMVAYTVDIEYEEDE